MHAEGSARLEVLNSAVPSSASARGRMIVPRNKGGLQRLRRAKCSITPVASAVSGSSRHLRSLGGNSRACADNEALLARGTTVTDRRLLVSKLCGEPLLVAVRDEQEFILVARDAAAGGSAFRSHDPDPPAGRIDGADDILGRLGAQRAGFTPRALGPWRPLRPLRAGRTCRSDRARRPWGARGAWWSCFLFSGSGERRLSLIAAARAVAAAHEERSETYDREKPD
jgi:hypothetical protein